MYRISLNMNFPTDQLESEVKLHKTTSSTESPSNVSSDYKCDKVCQWLAPGHWFFSGTLVSSTNKTDCHDITEILLKVTLNTLNQNQPIKL
jgi:hypothetical protein